MHAHTVIIADLNLPANSKLVYHGDHTVMYLE